MDFLLVPYPELLCQYWLDGFTDKKEKKDVISFI